MDNLELNEHQTNIFEQVAHYNNSDINNYINNTEKHLQEQQKLNEILKTEVNEANVKAIESFIENNEIVIDEQLHIMTELFKSLEEVSENNKELVHMKEEYANS